VIVWRDQAERVLTADATRGGKVLKIILFYNTNLSVFLKNEKVRTKINFLIVNVASKTRYFKVGNRRCRRDQQVAYPESRSHNSIHSKFSKKLCVCS